LLVLSFVIFFALFFTVFIGFIINFGFPLNILLNSLGYSYLADVVDAYSLCSLIEIAFDCISDTAYPVIENISEILATSWLTALL